jgi:hypothetical protein
MLDFSDEVLGTSDTFHEMFRVLERDSMKGTKRMSFRHIKVLADEVLEAAKAAHAVKLRNESNPSGSGSNAEGTTPTTGDVRMGGAPLWEEGENEAPDAQRLHVGGGRPIASERELMAGKDGDPARPGDGAIRQTATKTAALRLIVNRHGPRAPARPLERPRVPALGLCLVTVNGKSVHARTSPRWAMRGK